MLALGEGASVQRKSRREPAGVPWPVWSWGSITGGTSAPRVVRRSQRRPCRWQAASGAPELRSQPGGSLTSFVSSLVSDLFKVKK